MHLCGIATFGGSISPWWYISQLLIHTNIIEIPSSWKLAVLLIPVSTYTQSMLEVWKSDTATTINSDSSIPIVSFSSISLAVSLAKVPIGDVCRFRSISPGLLNDENSSCCPPRPMYSSLVHTWLAVPFVRQVSLISSPGQTLRPLSRLLLSDIWGNWQAALWMTTAETPCSDQWVR